MKIRRIYCFIFSVQAKFDNTARTGKISHSMDVKFNLTNCPYTNGTKPDGIETRPIAILLMILDMVIILVCSASLLLCLRSLWRGYRLRKVSVQNMHRLQKPMVVVFLFSSRLFFYSLFFVVCPNLVKISNLFSIHRNFLKFICDYVFINRVMDFELLHRSSLMSLF